MGEIRASDKIPGAKVRAKRQPEVASPGGRPREWLARADGAVQEAKTEGSDLILYGERSGVPAEVITADRVPNDCTCSWAYARGKLTLKHYNASCPLHSVR
jgi:hypothetical protein